MDKSDKYRLLATLVRGFFEAFTSGVIDCHVKETRDKFAPQTIKRVMLNHYEHIADIFHDTLLSPIAMMNFDYDDVEKIVRKAASDNLSVMQLVKLLCATDEMHQVMVREYKRNFELLLSGHYFSVAELIKDYAHSQGDAGTVPTDKAIQLVVRTVMTAYARGIRCGGTGKTTLHQPTVYRLMIDSMTALLVDDALTVGKADTGDGIGGLFLKACRNRHNLDVMTETMDQVYGDLVKNEGIIANDDRAS